MMIQTKEQSVRAVTAHQSASMNHHRSFLIHTDRISVKRYRTEISRDYTADQITRLYYETVESAERIFNTEHFVSLVQKEKLTCSVRRAVTRRLRMSYHSRQRLIISETASSSTTDRNVRHR